MEKSSAYVYKTLSPGFVRAYVVTMRPYLLFVSGITGLVGLAHVPHLSGLHIVSVFSACFLSYGFGQALTDCFQVDTDSFSSSYRPLTQGLISRNQVAVVSSVGLVSCISILAFFHPFNLLWGGVAGLGLVTYTAFKRKWWAGPFYNSWIVTLLCVMAFLTGRGVAFDAPLFGTLAAVSFGYANFVLAGYFKDIEADRTTAYNTLPVVYGRRVAAFASDVLAVLWVASGGTAMVLVHAGSSTRLLPALAFFGMGALATVIAQVLLHRVGSDEGAHPAISAVVHSYILILSGITCIQKPEWGLFLVLFYVVFVFVLKLRPAVSQI